MNGRLRDYRQWVGFPQGERGNALQVVLAIIGGLVVLALLAVLIGLWVVKRYVQVEVERKGDVERVEIRTPIGDLEVQKAEEIAQKLRLPVYPGAVPDEEGASVRLRGRLWEEEGGFDVTAAAFYTDDSMEKVDAWYGEQLGPEFKREEGRIGGGHRGEDTRDRGHWKIHVEADGDDVLYSVDREGRLRGVALRREGGGVKIGLFDIWEARPH